MLSSTFTRITLRLSSKPLLCLQRNASFHTRNISRSFSTSPYADVPMGPPDPIIGLNDAYKKDTNPDKVSLGRKGRGGKEANATRSLAGLHQRGLGLYCKIGVAPRPGWVGQAVRRRRPHGGVGVSAWGLSGWHWPGSSARLLGWPNSARGRPRGHAEVFIWLNWAGANASTVR